jgi:galactokinase
MAIELIRQLQAGGFDAEDAASRARLIDDALTALSRAAAAPAERAWFVPGRVEVFGKHTDYAGGRSLVGAVPRGFAVAARPRTDGIVRVVDARWADEVEVDPADDRTVYTGWRNYVAVVARRLHANFPGATLGADIAVGSDLPRAAGLSSSSALVVGLATALTERARLEARPEWRAAIETPLDLAGYLGAVENGLNFKSLPGTSGVGTHGGSEDHTAILTSEPHTLKAYAYVPVRAAGRATMPSGWRFVIAASGIQADKAGSAKDRYNRASLLTRALVDVWHRHTGQTQATLAEVVASAPDAAAALRRAAGAHHDGPYSAADLTRRLDHFLGEDARVPLALEAFRHADADRLGQLSADSQREADTLLGNQIDETRLLADLARTHGAFAASSFGAGFGGSVWALAGEAEARAIGQRWVAAYEAAMPALAPVDWFVASPASGVLTLRLT